MIVSESKQDGYLTELSNGDTTIFSDVTKEKGGSGEHFKPHDFICAGYATCLNITTRMILERMNVNYEKVIAKVDLDKSNEEKTIFVYDVDIVGNISPETKAIVLEKLERCPVRKTLSKEIGFEKLNDNVNS